MKRKSCPKSDVEMMQNKTPCKQLARGLRSCGRCAVLYASARSRVARAPRGNDRQETR